MTKYVELNAVLDAIGNQQDGTGMTFEALSHAMRDVMSLPQVDAVPIIHCKDCKHYANDQCDRYADETLGYVHSTQANGYCWVAERKEE